MDITQKIYKEVFGIEIEEANVNKIVKAVIVNFGDERGDIIVKNDNFGTKKKHSDFTQGKKDAGLNPLQIVFAGFETEHKTGGRYINAFDEICEF